MIRVVVQEPAGEAESPEEINGAKVDVDELLLWLLLFEEDDEEVEEAVDPDELTLLLWLLTP